MHGRERLAAALVAAASVGSTVAAEPLLIAAEPLQLIATDFTVPLVPSSVMDPAVELARFDRDEIVCVRETPSTPSALAAGAGEMAGCVNPAVMDQGLADPAPGADQPTR